MQHGARSYRPISVADAGAQQQTRWPPLLLSIDVEEADDILFTNVMYNKQHVLHPTLPGIMDTKYRLRARPHNFKLTKKSRSNTECGRIQRLWSYDLMALCKSVYYYYYYAILLPECFLKTFIDIRPLCCFSCYFMYLHSFFTCKVKVKFSHTRYRALGPELIPVYRQSARR